LALAAAGLAAIVVADPNRHVQPLFLIVGVVLLIIGMVLAAPGAIRLVAASAGHLPLAPRLALRDLARNQARAAAALAAMTLGLGIAIFLVVLAQSSVPTAGEGNLGSHQLLIRMEGLGPGQATAQTDADRQAADAHAAEVAATVSGARLAPLDLAFDPDALAVGIPDPVDLAAPNGPDSFRGRGPLYVATPELLAGLGIDPTAVAADTEVLTGFPEHEYPDLRLLDLAPEEGPGSQSRRAEGPAAAKVQRVDLPLWSAGPRSLVTPSTLAARGWVAVRSGWLVQADHAVTHDELTAARRGAAAVGFTVEARDSDDALGLVRTIATTVGVVLALAIVALTLGLLRGEAAQDLRTLAATGARVRTQRAITATTAGVLGLVGALMGGVTAYAAVATGVRDDLGLLWPVPVVPLVALVLGVPVLAAGIGWLRSGRPPQVVSRPLLD
jgi:putative ABC transport system permease protein